MQASRLSIVRSICISTTLVLGAVAPQVHAQQAFPQKPVDITVPYPPGGGVDFMARLISSSMTAAGSTVVVENKSGAGGTLGARYVAGRPKDGHSLLMMNDAYSLAPAIYKSLGYDPKKDLAAVINVAWAPMLLITASDSKYKSVADVVTASRAPNSKVSYGSCGAGTSPHLAGEMMNIAFKIRNTHVPYRGCGPVIVDVLGGQVEMAFVTITGAMPHIKSGKMRALAITSGDRSKVVPDVPTMAESGAPGFNLSQWQALAVPGGTPENVKLEIFETVSKVMKADAIQKKLLELGYSSANDGPEATQKIVNSDIDRFGKLAKEIGLTVE